MKKILLIVMAAMLLLSLTTVGVFAAKGEFAGFTDADNDGVCDNRESKPQTSADCKAEGFVDADNDGICDNREDAPKCLENGACNGNGYNRNHCGSGKGLGCGKNR